MSNRPYGERRDATLGVPDDMATRADIVVRRRLPTLSRRRVRELFEAGRVRVNGRLARKGDSVGEGDTLRIELSDAEAAPRPLPDTELAIDVLFEDPDLVALNKPAGIPTLPLRIGERGTLANFLATRYPDSTTVGGAFESGLVHRLDTGTSGVILAARTPEAYRQLRGQFWRREVSKSYLALVHGSLKASATIDVPIAHAAHNVRRMEVPSAKEEAARSKARPAITAFRPVRRFGRATLVAVRIHTGVRHQIRVHLATIRHPIVGDDLYAQSASNAASPDRLETDRPLLHARRLRFAHPTDGRLVRIVAPLPADLRAVLARLGGSDRDRSSP